jgi:ankyrin repeat protein
MIKAGASLDARDQVGLTAAMLAAIEGCPDVLVRLVKAGADLDTKDNRGMTALAWVCNSGREACLRILVAGGCGLDIRLRAGVALNIAADRGNAEFVKILVDAGANMDAQDGGGDTSAMICAARGHVEALAVLLEAGADLSLDNIHGKTIGSVAAPECLELLSAWQEKKELSSELCGGSIRRASLRV